MKKTKEQQVTYEWKDAAAGFREYDVSVVQAELEKIRQKHGSLSSSLVVNEAKHPRSVLHKIIYAVSDAEAARMGREAIAARLIRSIHVVIQRPDQQEINVRAFTSRPVPGAGGKRHYVSTAETMETEEGRAMLLRQAWLELRSIRRKYEGLSELAKVFDAIDETLAQAG